MADIVWNFFCIVIAGAAIASLAYYFQYYFPEEFNIIIDKIISFKQKIKKWQVLQQRKK